MLNYIKGEIYRVLHKKSMYIYFGIFAVLDFIIVFIGSGNKYTDMSIASHAEKLFTFLPVLVGGYLFAALYTDDLSSKNLTTLVGYGLSKLKVVLSKFLLITLFSTIIFGLIPLLMAAYFAMYGALPSATALGFTYAGALSGLMLTVAFAALSGIVVYGVQRNTFAIVLYILLAFGVVSQLVSLALGLDFIQSILPGVEEHLMINIGRRMQYGLVLGQSVIWVLVEYVIYVAAALALSVLVFNKKELEF
jgi:ABC-type transport system involved in multi-copper enzyme maturation permease subunit